MPDLRLYAYFYSVFYLMLVVSMMQMLGLNEALNQMAKVGGVFWYGCVIGREDGHILTRALVF